MAVTYEWRGPFDNDELNELHAQSFETRVFDETEWNWVDQVHRHSLGWVVARDGKRLIGFVNVLWDGLVHAWLQDTMVAKHARHQGVGTALVAMALDQARQAGCEWMHVDFEGDLRPFYFDACGFRPTDAGSSPCRPRHGRRVNDGRRRLSAVRGYGNVPSGWTAAPR